VDGYGAYRALPEEMIVCGCFAHARRYFTDALAALSGRPEEDRKKTIAGQGKAYGDQLFALEREWSELDAVSRQKKRQEQAKPILDEMFQWKEGLRIRAKSKVGEALTYLNNQWEYLCRFLEDGRIELSNNRAERSIKPFVIGRKNFLFANTPRGARTSAILYSIMETAKENGLDPYLYLTYIFKESTYLDLSKDDNLNKLLPASRIIQQNCSTQCACV
jgi:hypothetical protein